MNVITDITVLGHLFVFSQYCVQMSANLPNISSLSFDYLHCNLSVEKLFNAGQ